MKKSTVITFGTLLIALSLVFVSLSACTKTDKPIVEKEETVVEQEDPTPDPDPELEGFVISSVSGSMTHGGTFTVIGNGFGTKEPSDLLIWDDFENGTHNTDLSNGWEPYKGAPGAFYRNDDAYSGNLSAFNEVTVNGGGFSTSYHEFPATEEVYASYLFKFTVTGDNYGIMKLSRLTSDYTGSVSHTPNYNGPGDFTIQYQAHANWVYGNYNSGTIANQKTFSPSRMSADKWIRIEMYRKQSTPGEEDGELYWAVDGTKYRPGGKEQLQTRDAGFSFKTNSFLLGLMLANRQNDGHFKMYIDDVYVSNSRARVEIGNASTLETSTIREVQIPSAWADSSIQLQLNKGRLPSGNAYLYVIDEEGVANEIGYPVTLL